MTRALYVGAGTALVAAAGAAYFLHTAHTPEAQLAEHWTTFERYCVDCHNDAERTGGLSLEGLEPDDVAAKAATFDFLTGVAFPRMEKAYSAALEQIAAMEKELQALRGHQPNPQGGGNGGEGGQPSGDFDYEAEAAKIFRG